VTVNTGSDNDDQRRKVVAIISDYDGTLAPTGAIRSGGIKNRIPEHLEKLLAKISRQIPVCILSSKDYLFLHDKVPFANILSCILGIEIVVISRHSESSSDIGKTLSRRHLLVNDSDLLGASDRNLNNLAREVALRFPEIDLERKFTLDGLLAGITFDWRNQNDDWTKYSALVPNYVRELLLSSTSHSSSPSTLNLQVYTSHPFVDVYAVECDKGMGFDCIVEELSYHSTMGSILYLGDSENDNPAFERAGISVGVISDARLDSSHLKCEYLIEYDELAGLLELLSDSDFVFSSKVASMAKTMPPQVKDKTTGTY
jgi:HAD superfamily hydrolase (TIGR01484 family)